MRVLLFYAYMMHEYFGLWILKIHMNAWEFCFCSTWRMFWKYYGYAWQFFM